VFSGEEGLFYGFYDQGKVLNLTPLIQESAFDLGDFYPGTVEPFNMEGSMWAIPGGVNLGVTYYNRDLFDQYGAAYPQSGWTWDDLLTLGAEVSDPEAGVYGLVTFPFFAIPFVYQHGGRLLDDWRTPSRTTFDDPLTIEAIEWYAGLIHDYRIAPAPAEAAKLYGNDGNPAYIFWRRKAAMYGGFLSDRGGESWGPGARWQMQWGVAPLPVDAQASTLGFAMGYAISADTQHPEACWEWLTFLSEQMPPYVMPARRSLAESKAYEERVGPEVAAVARSSIEHALVVSNAAADFEGEFEGFMQALTEIANGDVSAMEALTELQQNSAR
jgi:multiple sugar transport system substrate-binding protein